MIEYNLSDWNMQGCALPSPDKHQLGDGVRFIEAFLFEINYSIYLRKPYYLGRCIISGIACIFGLAIAIVASAILLLSNGINQA